MGIPVEPFKHQSAMIREGAHDDADNAAEPYRYMDETIERVIWQGDRPMVPFPPYPHYSAMVQEDRPIPLASLEERETIQ